jgi:hypothetical protein
MLHFYICPFLLHMTSPASFSLYGIWVSRDCILRAKRGGSGDGLVEGTEGHTQTHKHTNAPTHREDERRSNASPNALNEKSGETGSHDEATKLLLWK